MENSRRETDAKIQLIAAQIEKIMAEIQQGNAGIALQAKAAAITEQKTQAEIAYKGEEVGLAKRGAEREDFKTKAEVEHKGKELGLKGQEFETGSKRADEEHKAKVKLARAQTGATLNPENPKKGMAPRKVKTRVTKHDERGRILEFEQEEE
jgi:hypothetical protein